MWRLLAPILLVLATVGGRASAAEFAVSVKDQKGQPAGDAVVSLWPVERERAIPATPGATHVIDQSHEAFIPFVTVMQRGDAIRFKNSDRTRHHVYSFSSVRQFELVLNPGESSPAVKFDQSGVAAIGCNIHDKMLAYAFVTDTPWAARTDAQGRATLSNVPGGKYRAEVWHPRMDVDRPTAGQTVSAQASSDVAFSVQLNPPVQAGSHRRHY